MKILLKLFTAASVIIIAGCEPSQYSEVDTAIDTFNDYYDGIEDGDIISTPDMPTSGTANYAGPIVVYDITSDGLGVFGEINLAANFEASNIKGKATDFVLIQKNDNDLISVFHDIPGTLRVTNGEIITNSFSADLGGTLTGVNGSRFPTDTEIEAGIIGFFITADGSGADSIYGFGLGESTWDEGSNGIFIRFVAE